MSYDCVYAYQFFFSLPVVGYRNGCADSINSLIPYAQQSKKSKKRIIRFAHTTKQSYSWNEPAKKFDDQTTTYRNSSDSQNSSCKAKEQSAHTSHLKIKKKERKKEKTEKRTNGKNSWFVLPSCATDKVDGTANADIECSLRKHIPKWVKEPASPTHTHTIFFSIQIWFGFCRFWPNWQHHVETRPLHSHAIPIPYMLKGKQKKISYGSTTLLSQLPHYFQPRTTEEQPKAELKE